MTWKLPSALWSNKTMHVPAVLLDAFLAVALERGWDMTIPTGDHEGAIGGPTSNEAQVHFMRRFFTSSIRTQFVMCDPWKKAPDLTSLLMERFGEGHLTLLDLAAGHGAGTLGLLATLHEARIAKALPSWPVTVRVLALDISEPSLQIYRDLVRVITPALDRSGIQIQFDARLCDLTMPGRVDQVVDEILMLPAGAPQMRLLALVSAISGMNEQTHQAVTLTLSTLAARLSHRNACWLWVEPQAGKRIGARLISSLVDRVMRWIPPYGTARVTTSPIRFTDGISTQHSKISWLDPLDPAGALVIGRVCAMGARSHTHAGQ